MLHPYRPLRACAGQRMQYILITPAHNEEAFIAQTIEGVIAQDVRPVRWIIVNDGSKDKTRETVECYSSKHSFITLVNVARPDGRDFGKKVRAFNQGFDLLRDVSYDLVGNLDADISVSPDYFARLLPAFVDDPRLGIAGGMIHSRVGDDYVSQGVALDSVAGAVQLFRRECFEQVGGYKPLPNGGIDSVAEITARMKGWRVRTFPQLQVYEHRRTGSAIAPPLVARLREGYRFRCLGYGFLFYCARCAYRLTEKPRVLGSVVALLGYLSSWIKRDPVALPPDVVRYLRREQREKLMQLLRLSPSSIPEATPGHYACLRPFYSSTDSRQS